MNRKEEADESRVSLPIIERLARQCCKTLAQSGARLDVHRLLEAVVPEQRRYRSKAWSRRLRATDRDLEAALTLAIERSWLRRNGEAVELTEEGEAMARRSRTGAHRLRLASLKKVL